MFARKRLVVGGVVVVLLAVGGYAYAGTRTADSSYRTATARTGTVERTLDVTGDVTASGRRDLSFGASGTVKKVLVKPGQRVRKGQVLARLDGTDLEADVVAARASLAKAKAQLVTDENSGSSSGSSGSPGTSASNGAGTKPGGTKSGNGNGADTGDSGDSGPGNGGNGGPGNSDSGGGDGGGGSGDGNGAQTPGEPTLDTSTVTAAEATLTARTTTLTTALNDYVSFVENTCTSSQTTGSGQACDPDAAATACANPSAKPGTLAEAKGCVAAAQSDLSSAANAVSTAATTSSRTYLTAVRQYAAALVKQARAQGKAQGEAAAAKVLAKAQQQAAGLIAQAQVQAQQMIAQARQQAAAASKNASSMAATSTQGASTSSEKQLASDRAAIASAQASLVSARRSARGATLRAPIAGKVVDVGIETGDAADTSSTAVTVLGPGDTIVDATVTLAQVRNVKKGQKVSIVPAGWKQTLHGTITRVGLLATTTSSGSTTYPIVVTLAEAARKRASLPLGTTASLSIVTGSAKDAVTVPTSAVTRSPRGDSVTVLEDGSATTTRVTVGLVGTSRTTITSGLEAGQTVVIADLDATLPSGDSSSTGIGGLGGGGGRIVRRAPPGG